MVSIVFETHSSTKDNEIGRASGWNDVELSELGIKQSKELGQRRKLADFDGVFCSDLQRAHQAAVIAFGDNTQKIFQDWRLREWNYGDFAGKDKKIMDKQRLKRMTEPFPNGESCQQATKRMTDFLKELKQNWDGKKVLIIGHRVTHYGLETMIAGKSLERCVQESLNWKWQPGWEYELK